MVPGLMQQAQDAFIAQVETIERTIDIRDDLIAFGLTPLGDLPSSGVHLHEAVRRIGLAGMQPSLDGSVLLLAAAFEQFVANLMVAFATELPSIFPNYEDLPKGIRSANENLTGEALSNAQSRFAEYDLRRFVRNLHNCQAGTFPYVLNGEALAFNTRNLTSGRLRNLMTRLGVNNIWDIVGSSETMKQWSESEIAETAQLRARARLDEFIQNRNQISHRVGGTTLGPVVVRAYVQFERALAQALVTSLETHAASF